MKKMKTMKKKTLISIAAMLILAITFTATLATPIQSEAAKSTKVKKPGQVKGLKVGKKSCRWDGYRNVSSVKISFKKVKGATGYQVLIYQGKAKGLQTPLVYAKNTKKTTYTIKNLTPSRIHTIKVRAYKKDKNGKVVYGKASTSIKVKTSGQMKGIYYTCNACAVTIPGNMNRMNDHTVSVDKVHNHELHAGGVYIWK